MRPGRLYSFLVIGGAALACVVSAAVNTLVDPYRVTPVSWHMQSLEPYRELSDQIRTGKAGLIRSGEWQVGLFGSSRVDNAWNPDAAGWQGKRVVNLGASGGFIYETVGIARYFLKREQPDLLVIGIDPGDMSNDNDTRPKSDYYLSPFGEKDNLDRELRYVVGISTLESSLDTLKRARKKTLAEYTPHGLRLRPEVAKSRSQMKFIRDQLRSEREDTTGHVDADKVKLLREFLKDCASGNFKVVLIVHPVHALLHARTADAANPPIIFEATRRKILELVEEANGLRPGMMSYWDFCNFHPVNCELLPADKQGLERMKHWNDLGHYDVELGESVLGRALGWELKHPEWAEQGREITRESIEDYLVSVREAYRAYLAGPGAADVKWKESLLGTKP